MFSFDIQTILSTLALLAGGTVGVWGCTEIIKRAKSIPWISSGDTTKIRATAGVLSAILAAIIALLDNKLTPDTLQGVIVDVLSVITMWTGSHAVHEIVKPKEDVDMSGPV